MSLMTSSPISIFEQNLNYTYHSLQSRPIHLSNHKISQYLHLQYALFKIAYLQQFLMSEKRQQQALQRMQSIINFKQLYFQQRQRRIQLEKQLQLERIKVKRMNSSTGNNKSKTRYCAHCSANLSKKEIKEEGSLIEQFKDFSEKMSTLRFPSSGQCLEPSLMSKINNDGGKKHVGMIQNFAIFGLRESRVQQLAREGKVGQLQGEILYSKKEKHDIEMQASKFVFPSGMGVKKCLNHKAKQKTIELMSYCYTNLKSFVLSFQCPQEQFDERFHHNQLLTHVNPARRLYCICIGIHDYTWIDPVPTRLNISLGNIEPSSSGSLPQDPVIKSEGHEVPSLSNKDSLKSLQDNEVGELQVGITQRVFCVMSYYPFFSFYQQVIRNLINIVKMQRLAIYKHNEENIKLTIKQTDSRFQMQRLVELFDHCYRDLQFKKVAFNKQYQLRLINQQKLTLMTYWDDAKTYFIRQWVYSILSMFTLQNFLDVWTLLMLEDKLVFICDNSNILTHTVYLFTSVLTRPLQYPFPIVSIIPTHEDEEFLSAPMPIVYGILKKRKAIEQRNILHNFDMTYVFLSPEKVDIVCQENRRQLLANRPSKLSGSKQLKESFRDLKKTRKKQQKSARYEIQSSQYCILASTQQKERALRIVQVVNQFLSEEVVKRLPNHIQVENMKKKVDEKMQNPQKDQHSCLMELISAQIRKNTKDPFITQMLSTQMVNNYVFK